MRVRITVNGEDLGDVEVDHGDSRLVRHIGERSKDVIREVLDKAVAQVEAAYGIAKSGPNELPGLTRALRGGGKVGAQQPEGAITINVTEPPLDHPAAAVAAEMARRERHRTT